MKHRMHDLPLRFPEISITDQQPVTQYQSNAISTESPFNAPMLFGKDLLDKLRSTD